MFNDYWYNAYILYLILFFSISILTIKILNKKNTEEPVIKNTIQITSKRILRNKKINDDLEVVYDFPLRLNKYIQKPTSKVISKLLFEVCSNNKTEDLLDICRCVTISSVLFNIPIPIQLVCLDSRTKNLYQTALEDLELKYVLILDQHYEKINEVIAKETIDFQTIRNTYISSLYLVGRMLIECSSDDSYPAIDSFAILVNKLVDKRFHLSIEQVKSLATAYAAITLIKIPKSYTNFDKLFIVMVHFVSENKLLR